MDVWESFEIIDPIRRVEMIASGDGIRDLISLEEQFGPRNWRKLKGFATVRLEDGTMHEAEIHWYEAPTASECVGQKSSVFSSN